MRLEASKAAPWLISDGFLSSSEFRKGVHQKPCVIRKSFITGKEFPLLSGKPQGPLLTLKFDYIILLRPKLIRYMVVQKENKLDFRNIMDEGKIFLAKLAQGAIGEEMLILLGTLIVSKLNQLVLSRDRNKKNPNAELLSLCDEFQTFITPSMASILSGARKYRLGLDPCPPGSPAAFIGRQPGRELGYVQSLHASLFPARRSGRPQAGRWFFIL